MGLHVIEQGIDTSTAEGRAMFGMLSVLAELQRELIVATPVKAWPLPAPEAATAAADRA
ncbi:recombinase family protein [Nonomuraea gerenzanensis]|uniref:Possible resolvase, N-terminal n=1 Tax=Nonomuraea gerenzanensis TaxID=93944 RepID=A0A1M4ECI4_9ACTN|nr:recombinase family protein [Nonomuraea gerenzanensis]UBU18662.1 recombinase family protein [Nonomuraea gerenzanensis]SBO96520.1 possible resolvase, N-terminal [Nonomuraea gerenzanensis]